MPFARRALLPSLLMCLASFASAQTSNYSEGGYADRRSAAVGENISFHISTSRSPFDIEIVNLVSPDTVLRRIAGAASQPRDCTGMWESGCNWPVTNVFAVPADFVPGYYAARFPTSRGARHILFVVRPVVHGTYSQIAVIQPTNTDAAYNRFGGKSVYDTISDDGRRAHTVSFNRPYFDAGGLARYPIWEQRFVEWMKAEDRKFEVITDDDMERGIPLAGYRLLLIVGHSEYWSLKARRHLEAFSRSGGHIAILGANTMWWQIRVNLQSRQMTVYKDAALDPLTGVDDEVVTTQFSDWPVLNPENSILGASFLNAGYVNMLPGFERMPVEQRTPYTVRNAGHWIFAGTGLTNGAAMGRSIAAIEVDGALFNTLPDGEVAVEGSDGTPPSYEILATLPASHGYATIGMYVNPQGGVVFNGAARDWTFGLAGDPIVQQMTRNVLDRLASSERFDYRPRTIVNRAEDRFNNPPTVPEFLPGWRYHRFGFTPTPLCAREGAMGLQMAGPEWTQLLRNLSVGRSGLSKMAASLWLNADNLTRTADFATVLVGFAEYQGEDFDRAAALEIMIRREGKAVRVTSFDDRRSVAGTGWIVLKPGWQLVQFSWESPGRLELDVSGEKSTAHNPKADQKMNAVTLEFAGTEATGSVCVDHLQVRDTFAPAKRRAARR